MARERFQTLTEQMFYILLCWVVDYPGNVFLIVLNNADHDAALKVSERIRSDFRKKFKFFRSGNAEVVINHGIKSISNRIESADSLIKLAFIDLYANMAEHA
ncbi:MAG TPA: hypothetical protein VN381_05130 [Anaerovoracaceae bacterium]|nr:hypothetical protein [Anaerovoracaceae bacterium]